MKKSETDIVELIERDHREVEELFSKFNATGDTSMAVAICDSLDRHMAGEEAALYPVIAAELPIGREIAGEGQDEHAEAKALVARIRAVPGPCDELVRWVTELSLVVEEHVDVEETEVLPQVRAVFDPEGLESLGRQFEAADRAEGSRREPPLLPRTPTRAHVVPSSLPTEPSEPRFERRAGGNTRGVVAKVVP